MTRCWTLCLIGWAGLLCPPAHAAVIAAILAGSETTLPADTPSGRLDTAGEFAFVGALLATSGTGGTFRGSAVALSAEWVLTAGHNVDLDDDGRPDVGWSATLHLPGDGVYPVAEAILHPDFTGFVNPVVNDDLALLRLATPLPGDLSYPALAAAIIGAPVTLVGFGRSGYGSYGYTTAASLTERRSGMNILDRFTVDDEGSGVAEVFHYDFDDPSTTGQPGGSLGNDLETIIGPGDSGGPALMGTETGWALVGINTFTEGYGGRFGDTGGGIVLEPYWSWIATTTGLPIPEPSWLVAAALLFFLRRPNHDRGFVISRE